MPQERDILRIIWQNFVKSLRVKTEKGIFMGTDKFGNKYWEVPKNLEIRKSKVRRYFDPVVKDNYNQELPAEWEAWLRYRRDDPPSKKELWENQVIADMKKVNAAELDKEYNKNKLPEPVDPEKKPEFPKYEEYEIQPGQKQN